MCNNRIKFFAHSAIDHFPNTIANSAECSQTLGFRKGIIQTIFLQAI